MPSQSRTKYSWNIKHNSQRQFVLFLCTHYPILPFHFQGSPPLPAQALGAGLEDQREGKLCNPLHSLSFPALSARQQETSGPRTRVEEAPIPSLYEPNNAWLGQWVGESGSPAAVPLALGVLHCRFDFAEFRDERVGDALSRRVDRPPFVQQCVIFCLGVG